jgi:hypothetical protein
MRQDHAWENAPEGPGNWSILQLGRDRIPPPLDKERLAEIERLIKVAENELVHLHKQKDFLTEQISSLNRERKDLLHAVVKESPAQLSGAPITNQSSEETKIELFRSIFRGRQDVCARRFESRKTGKSGYQPACINEWRSGICFKPQVKCNRCNQRQFAPLTSIVIKHHLPV